MGVWALRISQLMLQRLGHIEPRRFIGSLVTLPDQPVVKTPLLTVEQPHATTSDNATHIRRTGNFCFIKKCSGAETPEHQYVLFSRNVVTDGLALNRYRLLFVNDVV